MKTVLVTGGLRGIGLSVLKILQDEGFRVIALHNSTQPQELPNITCYKVDLSSRKEIEEVVKKLSKEKFYALVNVAGIALGDAMTNFDIDMWDQTIAVNLTAPVLLSVKLADQIEKGGSIINVSSLFGSLYGMNMSLSYGASKAALINVTKSLSYQLRDKEIRVNAVAPSIVDTDMTSQDTKEMLDEVSRRSGPGRIAKPEEIASIVSFLISSKASYVNGHTLIADGGYSAWDGIY